MQRRFFEGYSGGILSKKNEKSQNLADLAHNTLGFFAETASKAEEMLNEHRRHGADAFAVVNTLTAQRALERLSEISEETRQELRQIGAEPAIARLRVVDEDGKEAIYFISRAGTLPGARHSGLMASYRSPMGRLAALPVGGEREIPTPRGLRSFELLEHAALRPERTTGAWDSRGTVLRTEGRGPRTIVSLRALLPGVAEADEIDVLEAMLAEDAAAGNVIEGLQRSAVMKMGLRDQPLLDQYQDDIFRLPLGAHLVILGPPGTGKTTTLIKRLGLKLDQGHLEPEEQALVRASVAGTEGHSQSWLMFTPTELLKQYVKEAFNREEVAASDLRIQTWDDFRRDLARNQLGVLRTTAGSGSYVLKTGLQSLLTETVTRQTAWYDDFNAWQHEAYWSEMAARASVLAEHGDQAISKLGGRVSEILQDGGRGSAAARFAQIGQLSGDLQSVLDKLKSETDSRIRNALASRLRTHPEFMQELVGFIARLDPSLDDPEDLDSDSEDDEDAPRATSQERQLAYDTYARAMRAHARAVAGRRTVPRQSRNGRVVEFLGSVVLPLEELRDIGTNLQVQTAIRYFLNPSRRFITGISARYRRFRRERQQEAIWYAKEGFTATDLGPLEVDLILLSMLRNARALLANRRMASEVEEGRHGYLNTIRSLFRNQVAVDEATDFSPLQLACMGALCDPATSSFLACGDFNQRITSWGSRSADDLTWVFADVDIRKVTISYRHSRQLSDLAGQIALLDGGEAPEVQLPEHVNNEGVPPILATNMVRREDTVAWLAARIAEIERFTGSMPSVAVLVNDEDDVIPVAEALDKALSEGNVRCVPCSNGRSVGQDNDVRVFAVEHIKGLEFEAVFFIGVDTLAKRMPELFDKYLYVGATRAAYFLGITTADSGLPTRLASLQSKFDKSWR